MDLGGMTEAAIMRQIQLHATKLGMRLFRNNVGVAMTSSGSMVKFGLCAGSSDLIGMIPVEITQEMVGQKIAVFCAVEVKTKKGKLTKQQVLFLEMVNSMGGIGVVVKSPEDLQKALCKK